MDHVGDTFLREARMTSNEVSRAYAEALVDQVAAWEDLVALVPDVRRGDEVVLDARWDASYVRFAQARVRYMQIRDIFIASA